jgi:hypothetical protein
VLHLGVHRPTTTFIICSVLGFVLSDPGNEERAAKIITR